MKRRAIFVLSAVVLVALLVVPQIHGRPYRQKRVSDQRLADLETKIRLAGQIFHVPVGYGQVDPRQAGRRRRSLEVLLQELRNPSTQDEPEADSMTASSGEGDEGWREFVASRQSPPDWFRRPQV
jgi:hypothetical protein